MRYPWAAFHNTGEASRVLQGEDEQQGKLTLCSPLSGGKSPLILPVWPLFLPCKSWLVAESSDYKYRDRLSDLETATAYVPICRTELYSPCTRSGPTREYTVKRLPIPAASYQLSNVDAY